MSRGWLWKVTIATSPEAEDAVAEMMSRVLNSAASVYRHAEAPEVEVTVYAARKPGSMPACRAPLRQELERIRRCGLSIRPGRISITRVRQEDWANSWKRHFRPIGIGQTLLVKPSWSRRLPKRGQAVIILDPGLSFGTGQHPTTRFCLEQLAAVRRPRMSQSLLDIGCGSGILSLAAAKLGYQPVEGFDFDPVAIRIAARNVRQNRLDGKLCLRQRDLTLLPKRARFQYDVVCANLIYDLLLTERERIVSRVKPGGLLILAGILRQQFPQVCRAYEREGWHLVARAIEGEWQSGAFRVPAVA